MRRTVIRTFAIAALVLLSAACTPPPGGPPTGPTVCPTPASGQVRVAVVVDGSALGSSAPPVVCVVVNQGANGIAALNARAARIGAPAPRFNSSGLLCAIDGVPLAPACGNLGPNGYEYWSYWIGGSTWTYAPVGPASRSMQDGTVEGWRFLPGGAPVPPPYPSQFHQLVS
jgi:hypothetical protein